MEPKKSNRGRVGEGRPTKRTPDVVARIAEAVAIGLTRTRNQAFLRGSTDFEVVSLATLCPLSVYSRAIKRPQSGPAGKRPAFPLLCLA